MEPITGWIIYPRYTAGHSDNAFGWLTQEAAAAGMRLEVLFIEDLTVLYGAHHALLHRGGTVERMPSFVIMRTYDTVLSRYFERLGIPVVNTAAAMEVCKNKMLTHEVLAAAGIPTPTTLYVEGGGYDYETAASLLGGGRFVVKRIDGAKGEDVYLVNDETAMRTAVERCGGRCVCQEFIAESSGRDVRYGWWAPRSPARSCAIRKPRSSPTFRREAGCGRSTYPPRRRVWPWRAPGRPARNSQVSTCCWAGRASS